MRKIVFLIMATFLWAGNMITIAEYNVQNLFDLKTSGNEYEEYIPFGSSNWNYKTYNIKLKHTARVIKDLNADIVALCEIESIKALKDLRKTLQQMGVYYKYFGIANRKKTTVKVAYLSKLKPIYKKEIWVGRNTKYRKILEVKFNDFYLFINHWSSKSHPESDRIKSAKALKHRLKEIGYDKNFVITGDFNSDYEENIKFKRRRKLNNTHGITGINDILKTSFVKLKAKEARLKDDELYNLWYDLDKDDRWNYIHRGNKENLDSMIISKPVLERGGFDYVYGSFNVLRKKYLFYKRGTRISSWYIKYRKNSKRHMGVGYSDHLPIYAKFLVE
jgi:hypothetical protein